MGERIILECQQIDNQHFTPPHGCFSFHEFLPKREFLFKECCKGTKNLRNDKIFFNFFLKTFFLSFFLNGISRCLFRKSRHPYSKMCNASLCSLFVTLTPLTVSFPEKSRHPYSKMCNVCNVCNALTNMPTHYCTVCKCSHDSPF